MRKCPLEKMMQNKGNYLLVSIVLVAVMYGASKLGYYMVISDNNVKISAAWPPAGIALGALLLFGFRVLPAVWLGTFLGDLIPLNAHYASLFDQVVISMLLSIYATVQSFVAAYILGKLSSKKLFQSFDDSLVFLLFSGALTNLIACTFAIPTIYFFGYLAWENLSFYWLTYWSGDVLGVFVLTPLIVSWGANYFSLSMWKHRIEVLVWCGLFLLISYVCFVLQYPMLHFYLLIVLWATFRFGIKGESLMVLFVSIVSIAATANGMGLFTEWSPQEAMLILSSFLFIGISASILLAGALRERELIHRKLKECNQELLQSNVRKSHKLREFEHEQDVKKQITSLEILSKGVAHELTRPLSDLSYHIESGKICLASMKGAFVSLHQENNYISLIHCLNRIGQCQTTVQHILKKVLKLTGSFNLRHSARSFGNLNRLIEQLLKEYEKKMEGIQLDLQLDENVADFTPVADHLDCVLKNVVNNALEAMDRKGIEDYLPILTISTHDALEYVQIVVRDNGVGISQEVCDHIFRPFFSLKSSEFGVGLGLTFSYDWIVREHHGAMEVKSEAGAFTEIRITLPKLKKLEEPGF